MATPKDDEWVDVPPEDEWTDVPAEDEWTDVPASEVELPYGVQLATAPSGAPLRQPETPDKPAKPISSGRVAALGAGSGLTADFLDELSGLAMAPALRGGARINPGALEPQPGDTAETVELLKRLQVEQAAMPSSYEIGRDVIRREQKQALEERPGLYLGSSLGGALAGSALAGGAGLGRAGMAALKAIPRVGGALTSAAPLAQAGRAVAAGVGSGALAGIGGSEAESAADMAADALKGAAIGGAFGAAPHVAKGLLRIPGAVRERAAKGVAKAEEDLFEKARLAQQKLEASAKGTLGAETQKGSRQYENMLRYLNDPNGDPAVKEAIGTWLESAEGKQLVDRVISGNLAEAPSQYDVIKNARQTLEDLITARDTNIAAEMARGRSLKATLDEQVKPRLATMGSRIAPPLIGAGLGALFGGEDDRAAGVGLGTGAGSILALTMGNPTLVMRNMARAPSVRRAAWQGLGNLAGPPARAVAAGEQALGQTVDRLASTAAGRQLLRAAGALPSAAGRTTGAAASAATLRDLMQQAELERQ